jgi:hypothetical protein
MKAFGIPPFLCPWCGYYQDRVSHLVDSRDKNPPAVGDVTVCLNCGQLLKFVLGLAVVQVHDETLLDIDPVKGLKILKVRAAIKARGRIDKNDPNNQM